MEEKDIGQLVELVKIGGYLVGGGALTGFSAGIYMLFDRALFSDIIQIAEFEVLSYFLIVFMPSFVFLIVMGYLLATTFRLKRITLSSVTTLCVLGLFSMVLSALSIFYFISFLGGFLTIAVLIRTYTKPMFNGLSHSLAFFLVEFGALFLASFSALSVLMWVVSDLFVTYAIGYFGSYSPIALLMVGALAFLLFLAIPLRGRRGTNAGLSGLLCFLVLFLAYLFVIQSRYVLFNASAYIGMTMLGVGFALVLIGGLMYARLFFSTPEIPFVPMTPTLLHGRYCPYCGAPRSTAVQTICSSCGRSMMWSPYAPFCSACGRLAANNVQACPHCGEDIGNKRAEFDLTVSKEYVVAQKVIAKSEKEPSKVTNTLFGIFRPLRTVKNGFLRTMRLFGLLIDRTNLTLREGVVVMILAYLFGFASFVGYVRVELTTLGTRPMAVLNYGFPLEWLQVRSPVRPVFHVRDIVILWHWLALDMVLYFSAALLLVYGIQRLRR